MDELPLDIDDTEKLVRAILCPSHIKKGSAKLKPAAFRSKGGTHDVSVMRHDYLASDFCKRKGQQLGAAATGPTYVGLAVVKAGVVRSAGSTVHDSREEFWGHAHISHGVIAIPNEPYPPEVNLAIANILKSTTYLADPDPEGDSWTGNAI